MPQEDDLAAYLLDHYGECSRGADCYHGADGHGRPDGCLKIGWIGRGCAHWRPGGARTMEELKVAMTVETQKPAVAGQGEAG